MYYYVCFAVSLVLTLVYAAKWHKHFDTHMTLIFALIPVTNFGSLMYANARSVREAIFAINLTYISGCFLVPIIGFMVFELCNVRLPRILRVSVLSMAALLYSATLTIGKSDLFYKSIRMEGGTVIKEYGIVHTVFLVFVVLCFTASLGAMDYAFTHMKHVSNRIIILLIIPEVLTFLSFFGGRLNSTIVDLIPAAYCASQVFYIFIVRLLCLYDINDTALDTLVETGETGFISIDFKFNYLGSNETARRTFPELENVNVDSPVNLDFTLKATITEWVKAFNDDQNDNTRYYEKDGKIYCVDINYLYDDRRRVGYQFFITDDTITQRFNETLQEQVEEKTQYLENMHDKLITSMAAMVESRDNSTGGHIRRTSDVVCILIDRMQNDPVMHLTNDFCKNIIKAAPMHDLGKIAVDDAVLRKPGRFTPEEFEKMKAHAAEGARIIDDILADTDDEAFHKIARNVAHYHHERMDGSGYPDGLKGKQIPLEARIMAIADVYDALVSKRVYKDAMSFEKANDIMMESFGKHFDKDLEKYYIEARETIEEYYRINS